VILTPSRIVPSSWVSAATTSPDANTVRTDSLRSQGRTEHGRGGDEPVLRGLLSCPQPRRPTHPAGVSAPDAADRISEGMAHTPAAPQTPSPRRSRSLEVSTATDSDRGSSGDTRRTIGPRLSMARLRFPREELRHVPTASRHLQPSVNRPATVRHVPDEPTGPVPRLRRLTVSAVPSEGQASRWPGRDELSGKHRMHRRPPAPQLVVICWWASDAARCAGRSGGGDYTSSTNP